MGSGLMEVSGTELRVRLQEVDVVSPFTPPGHSDAQAAMAEYTPEKVDPNKIPPGAKKVTIVFKVDLRRTKGGCTRGPSS